MDELSWNSPPPVHTLPRALISPVRRSKAARKRRVYAVNPRTDDGSMSGSTFVSADVSQSNRSLFVSGLVSKQDVAKLRLDMFATTEGSACGLEPGVSEDSHARARASSTEILAGATGGLALPQRHAVVQQRERASGLRRVALRESVLAARERAATGGTIAFSPVERAKTAPAIPGGSYMHPTRMRGRWGLVTGDHTAGTALSAMPAISDELLNAIRGHCGVWAHPSTNGGFAGT